MHDRRNFIIVLLLLGSIVWAFLAWFVMVPDVVLFQPQRILSISIAALAAGGLVYALRFEDKLPDHMKQIVGDVYYEADGLTFMPTVRLREDRAELCLYYQNRFENTAQAVVHLRPPEDSFVIRPGMHDVHFAFKAGGGDFGVIHQPITVPDHLRGEVIQIQLAAASLYPRSHGARLRKNIGLPCGSVLVDWGGAAFKSGVHEASGEIELKGPVTVRLAMPRAATEQVVTDTALWRQERIAEGIVA